MARPRVDKPALCHHKASGRAFVKLDGRRFYLGTFGTAQAQDKYDMIIGEWKARGRTLPPPPPKVRTADAVRVSKTPIGKVVAEVFELYWTHAQDYYRRPDGTPTDEIYSVKVVVRLMVKLYADLAAADLDSLKVEAAQEHMVGLGWARKTINSHVGRIKRALKWMAKKKLIPAAVYHECATVEGLKKGRSKARETPKKKPVPQDLVDAIKPHVSTRVWSMIQLQLACAARPGEIVALRKRDINRTVEPWEYRPEHHKNEHREQERLICFGPDARAILRPYLMRSEDAYLFSPAEAEKERREAATKAREESGSTPMGQGNGVGTNRKAKPKRTAGSHYSVDSYRRAIERACETAFPFPAEMLEPTADQAKDNPKLLRPDAIAAREKAREAWREAHHWHPHRLRHSGGTRIREKYGAEAARLVLGVRDLDTAEIYAERDEKVVRRIMGEVG